MPVTRTRHPAILVCNLFGFDLPNNRRPLLELIDSILGGLIYSKASRKGHPTATRRIRMTDRFRVGNNGMDFFWRQSQHPRCNHGTRYPATTYIGRASNNVGRSIGINTHRRAGLKCGIKPKA